MRFSRLALIAVAALAITACEGYGKEDPVANEVAAGEADPEIYGAGPAQKEVQPVSRPTSVNQHGYDILVGRATPMPGGARALQAPVYVRNVAADAKPGLLSCVVLDKGGSLLGMGSASGLQQGLTGMGLMVNLTVTSVEESNLKCQVVLLPEDPHTRMAPAR